MSYTALYRKWRPLVFEDVVEQEHVVKTLRNSVNTERIAHAYLFCGTRGTGKTTLAKIFSRAINCLSPKNGDPCNECEVCKGILANSILDVIEIDAASNNSVDNVREIRDEVIYAPTQAKYKVYIIDEVHMLSIGAFNALLKTLEEPPEHVVFILATTDPHKLPATILSRCQRFDLRRITVESIIDRVTRIAQANGVGLQKEAARLIAKMSDGALRDAISILDQCISLGNKEISYNDVLAVIGIVNDDFIARMVDALVEKNVNMILKLVDTLVMDGKNIAQFVSDVVQYYRNLLICKIADKPDDIIETSDELIDRMKQQGKSLAHDEIIYVIKELSALESSLKWAIQPRILLEVSLIKICECKFELHSGDIMERLCALEKKLNNATLTMRNTTDNNTLNTINSEKEIKPDKKAGIVKSHVKPSAPGKGVENWDAVVNELKSLGRMVIYTNLIGTKAIELDSNFIGIVFGSDMGFNKMLVSKAENLEVIEGIVAKKLGREVRVKCIDENSVNSNSQDANGQAEQDKDELIEKAQDIAKRLNIPVNVIDD
ncbi:MAG: DNA polymerase III subunit gamma/tau [Clostridia bacterium]|nr:DNA polymerase III subunit gamma/tau [Clostridia bacterium]